MIGSRCMAIHLFTRTQIIPAPLDECWRFFSTPENLARLTPPALGMEVVGECPATMHAGMMFTLRVRPLLGLPLTWLTEITHVEPPHYFVDEQRTGPYRVWHHEHHFRALGERRTEMRDVVHYVLPFGWLGGLVHPWLVAPELRRIFAFRENAVRKIFGADAG